MAELLLKDEVFALVGAAMEVHNELGAGFSEAVYQEALEIELKTRGIPFTRQTPIRVRYKGRLLEKTYVADLICYGCVIVELKALSQMSGAEEAQVLNYLKATGYRVAVLINFGEVSGIRWHRYVY